MTNTRFLLLLTALIFILYGCKKDSLNDLSQTNNTTTSPSNQIGTNESHIFNSGTSNAASQRSEINADNPTILGALRINPYTVENMTLAYNVLNTIPVAEVATTNLYVKFCPQTIEEADELFDTDLNLYDYPLEYEVIEMGDSYTDPNLGEDEFPCFYAIVKPGYELPAYAELVDRLHLSEYNTKLTEKAFEQTGNTHEKTMCFDDDPNWPECQCDDFIGTPDWQTCIDDIYTPPPPSPPTDCLNSNPNRPSGFVRVQNTQTLEMEGVQQVKIILKDTWFTEDEVWTNHEGCFKLKKNYKKKMWMWVKWKSDRCKIRGAANSEWWRIDQILGAMKDYIGKISSPPYNNIEVNYYWDQDLVPQGSKSHMRWAASTVNNALHEFHDYAAEDGIAAPPNNLNFYLGRNSTEAYALMTKKIGPAFAAGAITEGIAEGNQVIENLFIFRPFEDLSYSTTSLILHFFPDIHIGLEGRPFSDQIKNVTYHEVAHASHYVQVGNSFWHAEIKATVAARGWGGPDSFDAGRIAVCESWAEHIGDTYTDQTFVLDHSNGGASPALIAANRWANILERDRLDFNHVPVSVYQDLIDDNSAPIAGSTENILIGASGSDGTLAGGGVTGFTNAIIFSHLTATTTTPIILRENLKSTLPSGTTGIAVDALFLDYGY